MLSVIIPALNAGATLPGCLQALAGAEEVIVVDGGSTDETVEVARRLGAKVIASARGRGNQLRAGAGAARGDWLLFLHADTRLAEGWQHPVAAMMAGDDQQAACFRFQLDDPAWQARLVEHAVRYRVRWLRLPYGDQGLLISRALYDQLGGYRPLPLMEDVDLVRRIGRGRLHVLDALARTSAERWRRDGWAKRSMRNLLCLSLWRLGVSPTRIARLYG